jgi:recombination associated protein RdgC
MATAELSLIWNERIQFTLTQEFVFKKIKSLDYLNDEFNEIKKLDDAHQQNDASLMLLSGELRQLTDDVLAASIPEPEITSTAEITDQQYVNN